MTEGNLEMAWGQFGKTAQVDPYMSVVVGPMLLTTTGAVNSLDDFDTVQMLKKRFNDVHDVTIFGTAHLSFYMGAGSGARLLTPDDFSGMAPVSPGCCRARRGREAFFPGAAQKVAEASGSA